MTPARTVDVRPLLLADLGTASPEARSRVRFFANLVRAATAWPFAGIPSNSALPCRRRPRGLSCPGHLQMVRTEVPPRVRWSCSACDDGGLVEGWEGSSWDLGRDPADEDTDLDRVDVRLSRSQYAALAAMPTPPRPALRTVLSAQAQAREAVVWGTPGALGEVLVAVEEVLRRFPRWRPLQLTEVAARIEAALIRVA